MAHDGPVASAHKREKIMQQSVQTKTFNAGKRGKSGFAIHRIDGGKGWSYPEHTHKQYCELVCATRGSFLHVINGEERVQAAGEIILIRETDAHRLTGRDFSYVNVMFAPDWFKRLEHFTQFAGTEDTLLQAPAAPCATIPTGEWKSYQAALGQLLTNSTSYHGRRLFAAFLLAMVIFHLAPPAYHDFPAGLPDWLKKTMVWISENRQNIPALAEVVRHSCRCHEHFTREFSRHMGMSPSNYLTGLRIDRAAEVLITTNNKLSDIAHAVGFENESYFFRAFHRRKEMTPSKYRKLYGPRSIR